MSEINQNVLIMCTIMLSTVMLRIVLLCIVTLGVSCFMLSVAFQLCLFCRYAEYHYAQFSYAECHYAHFCWSVCRYVV